MTGAGPPGNPPNAGAGAGALVKPPNGVDVAASGAGAPLKSPNGSAEAGFAGAGTGAWYVLGAGALN